MPVVDAVVVAILPHDGQCIRTHGSDVGDARGRRILELLLEDGRILAAGTPQEVMDAPAHETLAQLAGLELHIDHFIGARRQRRRQDLADLAHILEIDDDGVVEAIALNVERVVIVVNRLHEVVASGDVLIGYAQRSNSGDYFLDGGRVLIIDGLRCGGIGRDAELDRHEIGYHFDRRRSTDLNSAAAIAVITRGEGRCGGQVGLKCSSG